MNSMRRAKEPLPRIPTLESAIMSYVIAQVDKERIEKNIPRLHRFLRESGIADLQVEELAQLVRRNVRRLDTVEKSAKLKARLFTRDGRIRHQRYRHGSAFCSNCGMHKDYKKECPFCGNLEITH